MAIDGLKAIGMGLVMFGIIIGLGLITLTKLGDQIVTCPSTIGGGTSTWNTSLQLCQNASGETLAASGGGYGITSYVVTQMSSSGLAGWLPVIIVVLIAGLILALFGGKGKNY